MLMPSLSRRNALRTGATALAGATLAAVPATAQSSDAHAGALDGHIALVTGAGRGIGRAVAVAYARAGADVACLDICRDIPGHPIELADPEDLRETVRLVGAEGQRGLFLQADVRDYAALVRAVQEAESVLGPLTVAVANAGIDQPTNIIDNADDDGPWENVTAVNVLGVANTLRAVLPGMAERDAGSVITTASTFGRSGSGINPNYAASKWAVVGLTKSVAIQAGAHGVRVNAVAPTGVATGLAGPLSAEQRAQYDTFFEEQYHELPVGMLEPEDVVGAFVYLASEAAEYVTGTVVDVAAGANARYTG